MGPESNKICRNCGAAVEAQAKFCGICGTSNITGSSLSITQTSAPTFLVAQAGYVGRRTELAMVPPPALSALLRKGHHLFLHGESGLGKSAFLDQVEPFLRQSGFQVFRLEGRQEFSQLSFFPFHQLLVEWLGIAPDTQRQGLGASLAPLRELGLADSDIFYLSHLFPVDLPSSSRQTLKDTVRLTALSCAILHLVEKLAAQKPLALLFDHLHLADSFTRRWLTRVGEFIGQWPLLIVQASREAPPSPLPRNVSAISLPPLDLRDLTVLGRAHLESSALPLELEEHLDRYTAGNPLRLKLLLDFLVERDYLVQVRGQWRLDEKNRPSELPASIHKLLQARIERFEPHIQELLWLVAVLMGECTTEALDKLYSYRQYLREDLLMMSRRGFFMSKKDGTRHSLRFFHNTAQEYVYAHIPQSGLQTFHPRVVTLLNQNEASTAYLKSWLIAFHSTYNPDKAQLLAPILEHTGDYFASQLHIYFAITCYQRSSQILRQKRAATEGGDAGSEIKLAHLLAKLALLYTTVGDGERARRTLQMVLDLAAQHDSPYLYVETTGLLGDLFLSQNAAENALTVLHDALDVARQNGDDLLLAEAKQNLAQAKERLDRLREAELLYNEALATWLEAENDISARKSRAAALYFSIGQLQVRQGKADAAIVVFTRAKELAESNRQVELLLRVTERLAALHITGGEHATAKALIESGSTLARSIGDWLALAGFFYQLGRCCQALGEREDAARAYSEALRLAAETDWTQGVEYSQGALTKLQDSAHAAL